MTPDLFSTGLILSIWAVAAGAWVGALDRPINFPEIARWAASFGAAVAALCVINSFILC